MSETIDAGTVRHIGRLARLELTDEDVARYAPQLSSILAYARTLAEVDTTGVEPNAHPLAISNVLRADEPGTPLGAEHVLVNAPAQAEGYFVLPKVLDTDAP